MRKKNVRRYMISVLAYYRSEWTDVADDDEKFRLFVTEDVEEVLFNCLHRGMNIPNAARRVAVLLARKKSADVGGDADARSDA